MLVELKAKSQATIPKDIVKAMKLKQGDPFEIAEENGKIILVPVAIYPERIIDELRSSVDDIKASIQNGTQPVFDSIDALFEELDR